MVGGQQGEGDKRWRSMSNGMPIVPPNAAAALGESVAIVHRERICGLARTRFNERSNRDVPILAHCRLAHGSQSAGIGGRLNDHRWRDHFPTRALALCA